MGYDAFIRIATEEELHEETVNDIGQKFKDKISVGSYIDKYNFVGIEMHGTAYYNYADIFKKISTLDPNLTFIFYYFHFDYKALEITKIKNEEVIDCVMFGSDGSKKLAKFGIGIQECMSFDPFVSIQNDITPAMNDESNVSW